MRPDETMLVIGPRGSGKTVMMKHLLACMADKLDACHVYCRTGDETSQWESKGHYVHAKYSRKQLQGVVKLQANLLTYSTAKNGVPLPRVGVVLDGATMGKGMGKFNDPTRNIMMNGRCYKLFYMNGVGSILDVPKDLVCQASMVVVFPDEYVVNRDALRKHVLGGVFKTDEELVEAFKLLKPHEALVVMSHQRPLRVFSCVAPLDPLPFRVKEDSASSLLLHDLYAHYALVCATENTMAPPIVARCVCGLMSFNSPLA